MHYTYVIESLNLKGKRYTGHTYNLSQRLEAHNAGKNLSTKSGRPWKVVLYVAFEIKKKAVHFEKYLKTASGIEFANRHFGNS